MLNFSAIEAYWFWWSLAAILLVIELLAPGAFFIWLGLAAAVVGLFCLFADLSWQTATLLFAILSVVNVYVFFPYYKKYLQGKSAEPQLNHRASAYVGQVFVLQQALQNGRGRLSVDGTLWDISGPDLPAGARVKVTGVSGLILDVVAEA